MKPMTTRSINKSLSITYIKRNENIWWFCECEWSKNNQMYWMKLMPLFQQSHQTQPNEFKWKWKKFIEFEWMAVVVLMNWWVMSRRLLYRAKPIHSQTKVYSFICWLALSCLRIKRRLARHWLNEIRLNGRRDEIELMTGAQTHNPLRVN